MELIRPAHSWALPRHEPCTAGAHLEAVRPLLLAIHAKQSRDGSSLTLLSLPD